jgi:ribosomal subunit interface protein
MQIDIKAIGIELTSAIEDYVHKRLGGLEKFTKGELTPPRIEVEVGKTTEHHKKGDFFSAQAKIYCINGPFHATKEEADLYAAVDAIREDLERQLVAKKDRGTTLFRRGARSVKKMLKGLSKRNPFTSKY